MRILPGFISIRAKIVVIFLCVIMVPIFIMTINSYVSSKRMLEKKYTDLLLDITKQSVVRISEFLDEVEKISLVASYGMNSYVSASSYEDYPIQDFLRVSNDLNENVAYRMLMNYILMKDRVFSIYVYNLNGGHDLYLSADQPIDYAYRPVDEAWFQQFLDSRDKVVTLNTQVDKQLRSKEVMSITQARKVFDMNNGKLLGVMVMSINTRFIDALNNRLQESVRSRFTIVDDEDTIIYHADSQFIGRPFSEILPLNKNHANMQPKSGIISAGGSDYLVVASSFDKPKWTAYLYMPADELSSEGAILQQNIIMLSVLLALFASISSILLSAVITRPIKKLMSNIALVEKGQFDNLQAVESRDEIGHLASRFNRMSAELKQLVERIQKGEGEKAAAEIRALQSQINPHFLYNTLGSVKWIASIQKADKIADMTDALIAMLRYAAKHEGSIVPLRDEFANLENYMTIQNVRYYNRIRLRCEAKDDLLDRRVPKMILQPLVENAIFHGLAEKEEGGEIVIRVDQLPSQISIEISDNGIGMDDETLQAVQTALRRHEVGSEDETGGIGLANIRRRLQLHYGRQYDIRCTSELGEGTSFTLLLPDHETK